jgi:hypothetical protein
MKRSQGETEEGKKMKKAKRARVKIFFRAKTSHAERFLGVASPKINSD